MSEMKPMLLATLLCISASLAVPEGIPIEYMDARGRIPSSTRLSAESERGVYSSEVISAPLQGTDGDLVVLLVDEQVYSGISTALSVYQADLQSEGWDVAVWQISGGTATDIRFDLQNQYMSGSLAGAVAIGDIPTGWMENGYGEYPIDLYLMDMNGTWTDSDADGLYESYSNAAPEIWLGRLTPTFLTFGSQVELLNSYFAKNHAYRTGVLSLPDRALAYEEAFTGLTGSLDNLYGDVTRVDDPVGTNADDFKQELLYGYEWVHLISHSSPWGSSFHTGAPPTGAGTFNNLEVPPLDPHAFFYVLNCCSNGRWTEVDNLANSYIWCDSYGLAALAQAKVDYTNYFTEYYQQLALGAVLGEAFAVWLGNNMYNEDGAVLLGDPTLKPRMQSAGYCGVSGGSQGFFADGWLDYPLTDGLHTQGRVDSYSDPFSGAVFAVSGTSDPVRANILATRCDGDSWALPAIVCEHEYWDWHPTVGGDGNGKVWVAWQSMRDNHEGYDIYISLWNGSGWNAAEMMTSGDPYDVQPAMSGGQGHSWLVWQKWDGGDPDIAGRMWTGAEWTTEESIADTDGSERYPDVAWNGNGYGLVYHRKTEEGWVIGFRDAPDSGTFGTETVISPGTGENRYASIAGISGGFAVAWQSQDGEVMFSRSQGGTWTSPEVVSGTDDAARPSVAVLQSGNIIVSWTAEMSAIRYNEWSGTGWSGVETAASGDAVDDGRMSVTGDGELWLVYGVRNPELQWNLRCATPDPSGVENGGSQEVELGMANAGANPAASLAVFAVNTDVPAELTIFDMTGRAVHTVTVESGTYTWNCADEPSGMYVARLSGGNASAEVKLIHIR